MPWTQEELKTLVNYDPDTGIFTWAHQPRKGGRIQKGEVAGSDVNGYWAIRIDGHLYRANRLAWFYVHGEEPEDVDHKDGDPMHSWIDNLRAATHQQNLFNAKLSKANNSGVKGVSWKTDKKKWRARIKHNYVSIHLGYFTDFAEAERVVREKRIELHGEFANHGNKL